jgi:hypothetical protein
LRDPDFVWSAVNRPLLTFGYFTVQTSASRALVLVVAAIGHGIIGGRLSDPSGRRKPSSICPVSARRRLCA